MFLQGCLFSRALRTRARCPLRRDLWWNYPASKSDVQGSVADVPFSSRLWKIGMDRVYRPVYNNLMRTPSCATSYETVLNWDFEYIAPAHGEPVCGDAKAVLRKHLSL